MSWLCVRASRWVFLQLSSASSGEEKMPCLVSQLHHDPCCWWVPLLCMGTTKDATQYPLSVREPVVRRWTTRHASLGFAGGVLTTSNKMWSFITPSLAMEVRQCQGLYRAEVGWYIHVLECNGILFMDKGPTRALIGRGTKGTWLSQPWHHCPLDVRCCMTMLLTMPDLEGSWHMPLNCCMAEVLRRCDDGCWRAQSQSGYSTLLALTHNPDLFSPEAVHMPQGNQRWQIPRPATCQYLATFTPIKIK